MFVDCLTKEKNAKKSQISGLPESGFFVFKIKKPALGLVLLVTRTS